MAEQQESGKCAVAFFTVDEGDIPVSWPPSRANIFGVIIASFCSESVIGVEEARGEKDGAAGVVKIVGSKSSRQYKYLATPIFTRKLRSNRKVSRSLSLYLSVRNRSLYPRQDFKGRAVNQLWLEVPKFLTVKNNCLGYKSLTPPPPLPLPPVASCVNQFDLRVQDFRKFRRELAGRLLIKRDLARHGGVGLALWRRWRPGLFPFWISSPRIPPKKVIEPEIHGTIVRYLFIHQFPFERFLSVPRGVEGKETCTRASEASLRRIHNFSRNNRGLVLLTGCRRHVYDKVDAAYQPDGPRRRVISPAVNWFRIGDANSWRLQWPDYDPIPRAPF